VLDYLGARGYAFKPEWFLPQLSFRFPKYGEIAHESVHLELQAALEPWPVLGEQPAGGGTSRYVDSSLDRIQVKVRGLVDPRHAVACNGRRLPLHPTGTVGEFGPGCGIERGGCPSVSTPICHLTRRWSSTSSTPGTGVPLGAAPYGRRTRGGAVMKPSP